MTKKRPHRDKGLTQPPDAPDALTPEEMRRVIRELKANQVDLEASRERYRELYDLAPVGYCIISESDLIDDANLTMAEILGVTRQDLLNRPLSRFIHGDDRERYALHRARLFQTQEPQACEVRLYGVDRAPSWARLEATVTRSHSGSPIGRVAISDIDEHKRTELALRASERRLQAILNSLLNGFVLYESVFADDGTFVSCRFVYVNEAFERLMGVPSSEFVGRTVHEVWPGTEAGWIEAYAEVALTGEPRIFEMYHTTTGRLYHCSAYRPDDSPQRFCVVFEDVTERRRIEEQLAADDALLRIAGRTAAFGGWSHDLRSGVTSWSDAVADIHEVPRGYAPDPQTGIKFYAPEWRERITQVFADCVEKGIPYDEEMELITRTGRRVWVHTTGEAIRDETGAIVRVQGAFQDITKRKRIEQDYQALFREMIDAFALHEIICDAEGRPVDYRFLTVNPAFERMTGLRARDIVGHTVLEVLPGTERHWIESYGHVALTGEPTHFDNYSAELDAHYEVRAYQPTPGQFATIFTDVSHRRHLEHQLHQQARLAAVGQLAAGIAHDFRNLLTTIILYTQLSQRKPDLPPEVSRALETILGESRKAVDLVQQILDFSSRAIATLKPLDLQATIETVLATLRRTLPEDIRLSFSADAASFTIEGDAGRLEQALINLALNARDAMPNGGTLDIALTRFRLLPHALPPVADMQPGHWIRLSVTDTGTGMSDQVYAHLFEPFFTTKEVGKGTGLGLAQVYGIIRLHQGFIDVTTRFGFGTTFDLYLPAAESDSDAPADEPLTAPLGHGETLLLVEDNERLREGEQQLLEALGYRVITAADGHAALERFTTADPPVDLLITDIVMPEMGGKALLQELRRRTPGLQALGVTGYPLQDTADDLKEAGFLEIFVKPFQIEQIAHAIRRALAAS